MKRNDKKQQKQPESESMRLFRDYILKHYTNEPIKGSDKVYHTSLELKYTMHDAIPDLTVQEVTKVMGELEFDTASFDAFPVWVMHKIDGERELFEDFGFAVGGV